LLQLGIFVERKKEAEVLKKLAKKTVSMTPEQYRAFIVHLEVEAYRRAKASIEVE
jgi:hypothetical protein